MGRLNERTGDVYLSKDKAEDQRAEEKAEVTRDKSSDISSYQIQEDKDLFYLFL